MPSMVDILNPWNGAILHHSETANTIAEAVAEALQNGADLSGANLRWANLSEAKQPVITIQGTRHQLITIGRDVHIGCRRRTLEKWLASFEEFGTNEGYTPDQIAEYGEHLHYILRWVAKQEEIRKAAKEATA